MQRIEHTNMQSMTHESLQFTRMWQFSTREFGTRECEVAFERYRSYHFKYHGVLYKIFNKIVTVATVTKPQANKIETSIVHIFMFY